MEQLKKELQLKQEIINAYKRQADDEHIRFLQEQEKRGILQEKYEELLEENRKFKENGGFVSPNCANGMVSQIKDELIIKLRKENEELIEKNKINEKRASDWCGVANIHIEDGKKLQLENDELKKKLGIYVEELKCDFSEYHIDSESDTESDED